MHRAPAERWGFSRAWSGTGTRQRIAFVLLFWLALCFASFIAIRQKASVSFVGPSREDPAGLYVSRLRICYFSENPRINETLYWLYFPVHRYLMPNAVPEKPMAFSEDFPREPVYLKDTRGFIR